MYKKILIAGATGTLALSALAATAAPAQAVKWCKDSAGTVKTADTGSCKKNFGKSFSRFTPTDVGATGTSGLGATASPEQITLGRLPNNIAPAIGTTPAGFQQGVYQLVIPRAQYNPALKYTITSTVGNNVGSMNPCTTVASSNYYVAANVGAGCAWISARPLATATQAVVTIRTQGPGQTLGTPTRVSLLFDISS